MMKHYNLHSFIMRLFLHAKFSQAFLNHIVFLFTWLNLTILKKVLTAWFWNHVALQWMPCMKAIKLFPLWGANATKKTFFKNSVISNPKRVIIEIVLTFWGIIHSFLAPKGVFGFLPSSSVNMAYHTTMLLVTFFGFRGCLGAFASVSVVLFFSTLPDLLCDDFVEIHGSVSPSLRNGLGVFSSVPVVLFFSTLLDWFCDDFVEIIGSVSPS